MSKSQGALRKVILTYLLSFLVSVGFSRNATYESLIASEIIADIGYKSHISGNYLTSKPELPSSIKEKVGQPPGVVDLEMTLITANPNSIVADGTSQSVITVQLKDSEGTNITTSGGTLVLGASAGTLGPVTDNNNGTYTAILTSSTTPGSAIIVGRINGDLISDSEFVNFTLDPNGDQDGDGVSNGIEIFDGTDFQDPCSFIIENQTLTPTTAWNERDCDEDGLSNGDEIDLGTDPLTPDTDGDGVLDGTEVSDSTNPLDICSFVLASQTLEPIAAWSTNDCDEDGLSNQQELELTTNLLDPDTDGDGVIDGSELKDETDPLDLCSFVLESQTLPTSQEWKDADCDEDGLTNQEELEIETNPLDPDTDGDGVLDGTEVSDETNPLELCSYIPESQTLEPDAAWNEADCDEDGITNQGELERETNPLNPDTDGDGVTDGQELEDETDPLDLCSFELASQTLATSQEWKDADCDEDGLTNQEELERGTNPSNLDTDGDGVLDGTEISDETNPLDLCSFDPASQTVDPSEAWNEADCDNDGVINQVELERETNPLGPDSDGDGVIDGTELEDETDPLDLCSFVLESQTLPTSQEWKDADCDEDGLTNQEEIERETNPSNQDSDGDGVLDGTEISDETNPLDLCSFDPASQTVEPSEAWKEADCDNDDLSNQDETERGTNPLIPDTDNDGVPDGVEVAEGTDPLDGSDFQDSDADGVPNYIEEIQETSPELCDDYLDTDGDGVPDYVEEIDETDPSNGEEFKDSNSDGVPDYLADRAITSLEYEALVLLEWGTAYTIPANVVAVLGNGTEIELTVDWDEFNFDQFQSGTYVLRGTANIPTCINNAFEISLIVEIEVVVLEKSAPEDLILDNNRFEIDVTSDLIYVGQFTVIDPTDDEHTIILNGDVLDNQYFQIIDGELFWSSSEIVPSRDSFTIEVKVIDRTGNEFVKRFEIFREKIPLSEVEIPNTFTPNEDGFNDTWGIEELLYFSNVKIQIFEKSGKRVFFTTNPSERWDGTFEGTEVPIGSYYWSVEVGETNESRKGILNLLRN